MSARRQKLRRKIDQGRLALRRVRQMVTAALTDITSVSRPFQAGKMHRIRGNDSAQHTAGHHVADKMIVHRYQAQ